MRRLPEKETAPGVSRSRHLERLTTLFRMSLDSCTLHNSQESIFTAIPCGSTWRVKAISSDGKLALLGHFENRLSALGAALLMSVQAGGRVLP